MNRFVAFLLPTLVVLAAAALYAPYTNRIMYCDEANTLYQYASDPARALLSYATPNNHILHSLQVWLMTTLAGTSAPVVRFPAMAAGLIALALAYRVGRRLAGWRAGLLAAALLATAYGFADYAINARGYTLTVALTLALVDLVWATPPPRFRRRAYLYSLIGVCAALILTLPSMVLAIGGAGLFVLWMMRKDRRYGRTIAPMIVGTVVGGIVYLPSLFSGLVGSHLGMFGETDLGVMLRDVAGLLFGTPLVGIAFAAAVVVGVAVIGQAVSERIQPHPRPSLRASKLAWERGEERGRRANFVRQWRPYGVSGIGSVALVLIGVTAAAILLQYALTHRILFARNYFYVIAPLALLGGFGAARVVGRYALSAAALVILAGFPALGLLDGDYFEKRVVNMVDAGVQETDWLIVGPCFTAPVQHHLEQTGRDALLYNRPGVARTLVLVREGTLEENLTYFNAGAMASTCEALDDPLWQPLNAYTCTAPLIDP